MIMEKEHEVVLPPHLELNASLVLSTSPDSKCTMAMLYEAKVSMEKNGKQFNEIIVDFVEPIEESKNA